MLTVKEINEVSFGKAGFSGYKPEDVDNFIDQVAASFQELLGERDAAVKQAGEMAALNADLAAKSADAQRKLSILAQKIEVYREEEEGIKEAIINAQRMSKDLVKDSQQKADAILQDARAQAEAKLLEANEEARRITSHAQEDAAKAVQEYTRQAESKKSELEEIKRQVTAFRSSLLEMYKKHLECIDHIPVFRQKEERFEPAPPPEPVRQPEPPAPVVEPEPPRVEMPAPVPVEPQPPVQEAEPREIYRAPIEEPAPVPQPRREPAPPKRETRPPVSQEPLPAHTRQEQPQPPVRTLNDRVNYVQEQLQPSQPPADYMEDTGLSAVGIDLNAHSNIPEALRREKSSHYSNLPFGDGVEIDGRRRKR
ncbi:DivIVA domain-containing protein [Acutalibacter caecimuris]|uniref:DivIVA domain-containing protein n=1 Tax=Acutalibacter caecimuris TaxID=3093657 RepID=UPI002AC9C0A0|nr:DivIVA domain-containing protein [Acutalibacter sp. M00118]